VRRVKSEPGVICLLDGGDELTRAARMSRLHGARRRRAQLKATADRLPEQRPIDSVVAPINMHH
jgi:hypothetical protein